MVFSRMTPFMRGPVAPSPKGAGGVAQEGHLFDYRQTYEGAQKGRGSVAAKMLLASSSQCY
jgi:hypothetical protein